MICQRCGTEYENAEHICPRCFYGRPKEKKRVPKWVPWVSAAFGLLLVVGSVIAITLAVYFDDGWMNGSWEGGDLSLSFDTDSTTFFLINGETVLEGSYNVNRDSFTLTTEEGVSYIYRYSRVSQQKLQVMYNEGNETRRVLLNRIGGESNAEDLVSDGDSLEDALNSGH